ncbi:efflux transporter, outer membrane factor (OMF) lipoprotein, NodT family [Mucilaginibacter gossypiicola]|uniref:Efflux transporter, outer membrane factor (OMF) lipoprotein, NodT family n=1 Tax=Mucilaginibacter gossypiicola TaxID=551995 RepID=A0A1H8TYP7_9SPHI|nr:efflux transporter outer membrane subunit [Mucilaginibacter gossypiicola]SEO95663.1 efflux transporter, outer membrane factor (OMF) lipoprotein, NodT family [Mucilaginibacter gossypiicola]
MKPIIKNILIVGVLSALTACKVTQPYQAPRLNSAGLFRGDTSADTNSIAKLHWEQVFTDTILQGLIKQGIQHNIDLQKAYSVTRQAQAYLDQSKLAFYPSVNADAGLSLAGVANPRNLATQTKSHVYTSELTASWEADIWGKLKSAKKAQLASMLQSTANARAVQTVLIADIANNYYNLMALDRQLAITEQSVKNWQTTVNTMKSLKASDVVTGAAVVQSEASKYAVQGTIPDLKQSIWQTENTINLLLGLPPGPVKRSRLDVQQPLTMLNTGVPAQMLANRPDVMAAEYSFRNTFELTNVARTYFYPSLTLTGSGGYSSYSSFFGVGSLIGNLTAGLAQPIFNQGVNKTRLRVAKEQQQQALLNFQYTVLSAGQDVSNAMMSYQTAGEKAVSRVSELENLEKSVNYTQQLVRYGSANYTEVLTAEQSYLTAQLNSVNDHLQQLQAVVYLYRSLGGGWE